MKLSKPWAGGLEIVRKELMDIMTGFSTVASQKIPSLVFIAWGSCCYKGVTYNSQIKVIKTAVYIITQKKKKIPHQNDKSLSI